MISRLKTDAEKGYEAFTPINLAAYETFKAEGLPHRRVEEYKYTDLRLLLENPYPLTNKQPKVSKTLLMRFDRIVLANGIYQESSLPKGVTISDTKSATYQGVGENDPLITMNSAFNSHEYTITIAPQADVSLALIHAKIEETSVFSKLSITLGEGAKLTLIEVDTSTNTQSNFILEVNLAENAKLDHYREMDHSNNQAFHSLLGKMEAKAELRSFTLNLGTNLSRNQYFITQKGDDCLLNLSGIAIQKSKGIADTTLQIKHEGLRGESRETFKYVLANGAKGVFQGKIIVDKEAQKTDGKMASNCVMLDDLSEMMNKPELEIYADDVLCGHGATCGELDDDLLFYFLARGIDRETARQLLIQAFVGEALELIENEKIKAHMTHKLESALAA